MRETIKQSVLIYLVLTIITGVAYPLAITGIAQLAFPAQANGSLVKDKATGRIIGSELIGQEFSEPKYFWGRLSATTPAYNAGASSGSNLGPLSPSLVKNAKARIDALNRAGSNQGAIPVDLVTSSGSGLDPDISISSAQYQVKRVAQARGIPPSAVAKLLQKQAEPREYGCLGETRVNVLRLNIALDSVVQSQAGVASGSE